jgi:molecular chaperone DnaK (HSP70)
VAELTKWSLGIASRGGTFIVIIPKNTPLPVKRRVVVTTTEDNQPNIGLDIRLGEESRASENFAFSCVRLDDVEKAAKGVPRVKLTFYAYANSVYNIGVRYKDDDPEQLLTVFPSFGMSQSQVTSIHNMISKMAEACQPVELETLAGATIPLPSIK